MEEGNKGFQVGEKKKEYIYFDHGAVDRHLDNVEGVIVPATVIVKADLPCQPLDFHLKVKWESKSLILLNDVTVCDSRSFMGRCL